MHPRGASLRPAHELYLFFFVCSLWVLGIGIPLWTRVETELRVRVRFKARVRASDMIRAVVQMGFLGFWTRVFDSGLWIPMQTTNNYGSISILYLPPSLRRGDTGRVVRTWCSCERFGLENWRRCPFGSLTTSKGVDSR